MCPLGIEFDSLVFAAKNTFMMMCVYPRTGGNKKVEQVYSLEELIFLYGMSSRAQIFSLIVKGMQMDLTDRQTGINHGQRP
ncbi:hypothetical protein W01_15510 [Candidatus Nitrotoga sp. AM1P]|nr:hypothetical protein W01_15510 [Candidatus Nitrotoga sp. AM1P]